MTDQNEKFIKRLSRSGNVDDPAGNRAFTDWRKKSYRRGTRGEQLCTAFLFLKGYGILKKRFKSPVGEIDIIAKKGGTLVFIEVKSHKTYTSGVENVTETQKRRIIKAAKWYLSSHPGFANYDIRFDVMVVTPLFSWLGWINTIKHIRNAFADGF